MGTNSDREHLEALAKDHIEEFRSSSMPKSFNSSVEDPGVIIRTQEGAFIWHLDIDAVLKHLNYHRVNDIDYSGVCYSSWNQQQKLLCVK